MKIPKNFGNVLHLLRGSLRGCDEKLRLQSTKKNAALNVHCQPDSFFLCLHWPNGTFLLVDQPNCTFLLFEVNQMQTALFLVNVDQTALVLIMKSAINVNQYKNAAWSTSTILPHFYMVDIELCIFVAGWRRPGCRLTVDSAHNAVDAVDVHFYSAFHNAPLWSRYVSFWYMTLFTYSRSNPRQKDLTHTSLKTV